MASAEIIVKIVDQTRGGLGTVSGQVDKLGRSATTATGSFGNLTKAVGGLAAAFGAREFLQFGDNVQNIQNRLALVNPELGTLTENFERVVDIANRTFQPLDAVAGLYQKVANSAADYGLSITEVETVTETFTNLLRLAGADAGTAAGAITQFAQALGSGTLRGDELNSVIEATAGEILPLLAEELGVSRGEIRDLAKEGKITGDVLLNALGNGADEVGEKVGNMSVTIGGAITTLKNNFLALGTEATPVFELIAEAILLIAENLDTVVVAAGAFVASLAAAKLAAIVTSIGGITTAFKALTTVMKANPVVLFASLATTAIVALYEYWDELSGIVENTFLKMERFALEFVKSFLEFMENTINNTINGFENLGTKTGAVFKGIAAAAKDPLNAVEAFRAELEKAEEQVANNIDKTVDFSGKTEALDSRIKDLTRRIETNSAGTEDNTDAKDENVDTTQDLDETTKDLNDTLDEQSKALAKAYQEYGEYRLASMRAAAAVDDSIQAIENETATMELNENQRELLSELIKLEEENRENLGLTTVQVSADQEAAILSLLGTEELYTSELLSLTSEQIQAFEDAIAAKQAQREATIANNKAMREAEQEKRDFDRETERLLRENYEATTTEIQRLEDAKQDYIANARDQGLLNHKDTQDAILEYDRQIKDAQIDEEDRLLKERQRALDEFKSEYDLIYDDIYGIIEDFTGLSSRELERYNQYAKLLLGVDILGAVDGFVTNGLLGINNFATGGINSMGVFANTTGQLMTATGDYIATPIFGVGGIADGGILGFVARAAQAFGSGGGLFGIVTTLFGGLGDSLLGIFDNIFGFLGSGLSGFGGILGDVFGGLGGLVTGGLDFLLGGIGSIASGILGIFGFAEGGYIKPGSSGIVGEAGPEIVSGPAYVTSARDTADMMGSGGAVAVNFTINAVDAQGIDQLLIDRKPLITNIVRNAVASQGRRI